MVIVVFVVVFLVVFVVVFIVFVFIFVIVIVIIIIIKQTKLANTSSILKRWCFLRDATVSYVSWKVEITTACMF